MTDPIDNIDDKDLRELYQGIPKEDTPVTLTSLLLAEAAKQAHENARIQLSLPSATPPSFWSRLLNWQTSHKGPVWAGALAACVLAVVSVIGLRDNTPPGAPELAGSSSGPTSQQPESHTNRVRMAEVEPMAKEARPSEQTENATRQPDYPPAAPVHMAEVESGESTNTSGTTDTPHSRSHMASLDEDEENGTVPPVDEWLKRIRQLQQEGKTKDVKQEVRMFIQHYPAKSLPKDLQPLAPSQTGAVSKSAP